MKTYVYIAFIFLLFSCGEKLEERPNSSIVLPRTVSDFEQLLDNPLMYNCTPALGQLSSDEYYIPNEVLWQGLPNATQRNAYIWAADIYEGRAAIRDWNSPYQVIFYSNSILEELPNLEDGSATDRDRLEGWALFCRAYAHFWLAATFCKAYDPLTASQDPGIPIRLNAGIDVTEQRASLENTFGQMIQDIKRASELLPAEVPRMQRNRPSAAACHAMLARIFLYMGKYEEALEQSERALTLFNTLTDYNTLDTLATFAFTYNADEVLLATNQFADYASSSAAGNLPAYGVDTVLLASYGVGDLRFPVYFRRNTQGNYNIKAINTRANYAFTGLATDELYLTRAECLAKKGEVAEAMNALNTLLVSRMKTGVVLMRSTSAEQTLQLVLAERRKSLVWRGLRWLDLKRLNREGAGITLRRKLGDQEYALPPNDLRYVLPIPDDEISQSNILQNAR